MCWLSFHMHMWAKWRRWWWHCYSSAPNPIFIYDKYAFSVSSLLLSAHTFKWPRFCIKVCLLSALFFALRLWMIHILKPIVISTEKYESEKCMKTKAAHNTATTTNWVIPFGFEMLRCAQIFYDCVLCKMFAKFSNLLYSYHVRSICCLSFFSLYVCLFALSLFLCLVARLL